MVAMQSQNLFSRTNLCLQQADPDQKRHCVEELVAAWHDKALNLEAAELQPIGEPGRPARPRLVAPRELPRRKLTTPQGHAALIHAICHIEFNAINLALDAVYRFRDLPSDFYSDWLRVAREEAEHFGLLREHLRSLGYDYGDFDAHNGVLVRIEGIAPIKYCFSDSTLIQAFIIALQCAVDNVTQQP